MKIGHRFCGNEQSRLKALRFALPALMFPWALACQASDYQISQYDRVVKVDDVGHAVTSVTLKIVLSSDAALQRFSQYVLAYNPDFQTLSIDAAETIHADGTHVAADARTAVFDRAAPVTISAPQFSSEHLRIVAFPATARGDTVMLSYTLSDIDTVFPGKFTDQVVYPLTEDYRDASVTLDTPAAMPVMIDAAGLQAQEDTVTSGRHVRRYRYRTPSGGPVAQQANVLAGIDVGPHFVATNFHDYAEIGQSYRVRSGEQNAPSATVQQLAEKLTEGVSSRREQAQRIYEWVSRNVRYVGVYIGTGTVVPRSADVILNDRYGDCKDHVTLFSALLKARHIDSDSVLINLGNGYRLPSAPDWNVFNHVITWLPEFGVFADTTSGFAPFGTLSFDASDKPAVDTSTGAILHTPPQNAANSRSSIDYELAIDDSGNSDFKGSVELLGQAGINARRTFSQTPVSQIEYELLSRNGLTGTLHFNRSDPGELEKPFLVSMQGNLNQIAIMPGPAALAMPRLPNYGSIQSFADLVLQQRNRPLEGTCAGTRLSERYNVKFPHQARIMAIPPDVAENEGDISYRSSYREHNHVVEISRVLERRLTSNVCSGAKLAEWAGIAGVISKDLKRQVLYK